MTFKDFGNRLDEFGKGLPNVLGDAYFKAINQTTTNIQKRVFNSAKDKDGNPIGKYSSESYKKRRQKKGLQIGTVDLMFNKDLQRSIVNGVENGLPVTKFSNQKQATIGRANEERFKGKTSTIFAASTNQKKQANEIIEEEINDYIKKVFKQ